MDILIYSPDDAGGHSWAIQDDRKITRWLPK